MSTKKYVFTVKNVKKLLLQEDKQGKFASSCLWNKKKAGVILVILITENNWIRLLIPIFAIFQRSEQNTSTLLLNICHQNQTLTSM